LYHTIYFQHTPCDNDTMETEHGLWKRCGGEQTQEHRKNKEKSRKREATERGRREHRATGKSKLQQVRS
jgi:hypothetical protein